MATLNDTIKPMLLVSEKLIWIHELNGLGKPNYEDKVFAASAKIFMSTLMDKMFDLQEKEGLSFEDRNKMAFAAGNAFRGLVKTYTDIDTWQMFDDKKNNLDNEII